MKDRILDCPVFELADGRRALQLWESWTPPPISLPNVFAWEGRFYYVLTKETVAQLIVDAIDDPATSERKITLLRRMVTELEWAEAVEMVDTIRAANVRPMV